jgi:site-specific DNA-methyltransferase (adenine-specific)
MIQKSTQKEDRKMKSGPVPWRTQAPKGAKEWPEGILVCCDALEFLTRMASEIADIVFLDPPFNLGKKYGTRKKKDDLMSQRDYISFMDEVLEHSIRVLKPGGALYLYHIPQWALRLGSQLEKQLSLRHWIAISMKNGFARGNFLYPAHYALLYFTKGTPNVFRRPKVPVLKCRHCGKLVRDYGGYSNYVRDGVNLSDVWDDLSPVRHPSRKNRPANELPLELLRRVVRISGLEGGVLVDPFVGSGTSVVASIEAGMQFLACDREPSCCDVTAHRFAQYQPESVEV